MVDDPIGDEPTPDAPKKRRAKKVKTIDKAAKPQVIKSKAKILEDAKKEAAPAPDILGGGKKRRIDLSKIRADVSAPLCATKREYHVIPVRKPGNQKCFRTFPKTHWFEGAAIAIREEDKERKPYLFSAAMAALVPAQVSLVTLVPYVDRQLNLCLWPLKHNTLTARMTTIRRPWKLPARR